MHNIKRVKEIRIFAEVKSKPEHQRCFRNRVFFLRLHMVKKITYHFQLGNNKNNNAVVSELHFVMIEKV